MATSDLFGLRRPQGNNGKGIWAVPAGYGGADSSPLSLRVSPDLAAHEQARRNGPGLNLSPASADRAVSGVQRGLAGTGPGRKLGETSGAEAAAYAESHPGLSRGSDVFGRNDRAAHLQRNADFIASGRGSHFQARPASSRGRNMEELRGLKRYELESGRRADLMRAQNDRYGQETKRGEIQRLTGLKQGELAATVEKNKMEAENDQFKTWLQKELEGRKLDILENNNNAQAASEQAKIEAMTKMQGREGEAAVLDFLARKYSVPGTGPYGQQTTAIDYEKLYGDPLFIHYFGERAGVAAPEAPEPPALPPQRPVVTPPPAAKGAPLRTATSESDRRTSRIADFPLPNHFRKKRQ
jgi:hypothetical protein